MVACRKEQKEAYKVSKRRTNKWSISRSAGHWPLAVGRNLCVHSTVCTINREVSFARETWGCAIFHSMYRKSVIFEHVELYLYTVGLYYSNTVSDKSPIYQSAINLKIIYCMTSMVTLIGFYMYCTVLYHTVARVRNMNITVFIIPLFSYTVIIFNIRLHFFTLWYSIWYTVQYCTVRGFLFKDFGTEYSNASGELVWISWNECWSRHRLVVIAALGRPQRWCCLQS